MPSETKDKPQTESVKPDRPENGSLTAFKKFYGPVKGVRIFRDVCIAGGVGDLLAGSHTQEDASIDLPALSGNKAVEEVLATANKE